MQTLNNQKYQINLTENLDTDNVDRNFDKMIFPYVQQLSDKIKLSNKVQR